MPIPTFYNALFYTINRGRTMKLAGVDLAWQSDNKPSGMCFGELSGKEIEVTDLSQQCCI
jgi:hypothetical protein